MHLNHDYYVVVGKNVVEKMRTRVTNTISLYELSNILLLFICFSRFILSFEHTKKKFYEGN